MIQILSHTITLGHEFPTGLRDDLNFAYKNVLKALDLLEITHHLVCICFAIYFKFQKS